MKIKKMGIMTYCTINYLSKIKPLINILMIIMKKKKY